MQVKKKRKREEGGEDVQSSTREFTSTSNNFFNTLQEIFFRSDLPPSSDRKHSSFGANTPQFGSSRVRTQPRNQVESNVARYRH